jgi:hypothetical protein
MARFALAAFLLGSFGAAAQDPTQINWLTDRKQAFDQARKTGKPIWVLFR